MLKILKEQKLISPWGTLKTPSEASGMVHVY